MTYWTCPEEWTDETAWIICGGASLRGVDLSPLATRRTIAINSSLFAAPFATFCFFGDRRWFVEHQAAMFETSARIVSNSPSVRHPRVLTMQKVKPPPGIVDDRETLPMLWTSTAPAMNLAKHLGARRIVLLGLDGHFAADGRIHHHAEYDRFPALPNNWQAMQFESLGYCVKPLEDRGIEVINANPSSSVPFWTKRAFDQCLREFT
jgi:hypothetical protein